MKLRSAGTSLLLFALGGCATRAQVLQQDRQYRGMLQEQRRQLQELQHEVERLRADMEEGHGGKGGAGGAADDRLAALEQRVSQLEGGARPAAPPATEAAVEPPRPTAPPAPPAPATAPSPASAPPGAPPAATSADDEWRRELAREQAAAGAVNVPERAEYLGLLDGLARQDCTRAVPQLNSFAANHKESPLADNALYWAARCYQQKGRQEEAISKFYEVGTKYPKGDKAPAALWAQGNLFLQMGNSPDARIVFSKLIRDYPGSDEAARARQKLTQLEN